MKSRRLPFTVLLPLFSLAMLASLVAIPITLDYLRLRDPDTIGRRSDLSQRVLVRQPSATRILTLAASIERSRIAYFINGIDVLANFVELPIDRFTSAWPDTWHPLGFTVFSWRAVTFPVYSLPFWWFAGFGLDVLLRRLRPHWAALFVGTVVFAAAATIAIGLTITMQVRDGDDREMSVQILIGLWTWTLLFAAFPAAWFVRFKESRQLKLTE